MDVVKGKVPRRPAQPRPVCSPSPALSDAMSLTTSSATKGPIVPTAPRRPSAATAFQQGAIVDESNFCTNWQPFQQQVFEEQKARALQREKDLRKVRKPKTSQPHEPHPPTTVTAAAKRTLVNKLENLPGSIAPTVASGELVYSLPGHGTMATQHIYEKACRQYARRVSNFALQDAVRRIQHWFRRNIVVRRSLRSLALGVRVNIRVRSVARHWLAITRQHIAERRRREQEQTCMQPKQQASALVLQTMWRAALARKKASDLRIVRYDLVARMMLEEKRIHAARRIQATWRMVVQRARTRLARSSLKHFRVGRVIHQVRWYFFRKDRSEVRKSVQERENHAACVILRNWRAFARKRQLRCEAFIAQNFHRVRLPAPSGSLRVAD